MSATPDQVRARLASILDRYPDDACRAQLELLLEILPELIALASGRSYDDAGARYRDPVDGA